MVNKSHLMLVTENLPKHSNPLLDQPFLTIRNPGDYTTQNFGEWLNISTVPSVLYNCTTVAAKLKQCQFESSRDENNTERGPTLLQQMEGIAEFRAAMMLVTWAMPLLVGVGVVGNVVSLWVLMRRGMRRTSACRYLAGLAVADIAVLLVSGLKTWVRVVWGAELLHVSPVLCKLVTFITHISLTSAAWLIVAVTLERFLAVWLPLRATELCSISRTRVVIASVVVFLALINSHVFWTAELVPVSPKGSLSSSGVQCASYAHQTIACFVFPWIHLALYCFLPACLLLGLNSLILIKLFQHRRTLAAQQETSSSMSTREQPNGHHWQHSQKYEPIFLNHYHKSQSLQKRAVPMQSNPRSQSPHRFHQRLALMLLGVSFSWLALSTPQTIHNLAAPIPMTLEEFGEQHLVRTVCYILMYLNHSINFFLYCLTGRRFRQELRRIFMCKDVTEKKVRIKRTFKNDSGNIKNGSNAGMN